LLKLKARKLFGYGSFCFDKYSAFEFLAVLRVAEIQSKQALWVTGAAIWMNILLLSFELS
jgi:hypothetical protein